MSGELSSPFGVNQNRKPVARQRLQYLRMYRWLFDNPRWMANVGWGALAAVSQILIPFIGYLAFFGYLYEVIESLHRYPERTYPDFNIHRFADYLSRGIWPFLVSLIIALPMVVFTVLLYFGGIFGVAVAMESDDPVIQAVVVALIPVAILTVMAFSIAMSVVITPFMLQAGFCRNMNSEGGLNFRRAKQFIRLTWFESALGALFYNVSGIPIMMLGILCCYVGQFVSIVWLIFASFHLQLQLYEIYLTRGGEPFPLVEPPPPPATPVDANLA